MSRRPASIAVLLSVDGNANTIDETENARATIDGNISADKKKFLLEIRMDNDEKLTTCYI